MTEQGSALPGMVVLLLGGLLALALAYDLGRWAATWRETAYAADVAAEAGAAMLDRPVAYAGNLELDPILAEETARQAGQTARPRAGRTVLATAGPEQVCVRVTQGFRPTLLRMAGVGSAQVSARACASPRQG